VSGFITDVKRNQHIRNGKVTNRLNSNANKRRVRRVRQYCLRQPTISGLFALYSPLVYRCVPEEHVTSYSCTCVRRDLETT